MAITNTWNVVQMDAYPEKDGEEDVVFTVHWTLNGTDGTYNGSVYGSVGVNIDPDQPFTPYEELTQEQVIGWVKDALGEEQVTSYEENVAQQIENQINPPVITPPLPWAVPDANITLIPVVSEEVSESDNTSDTADQATPNDEDL